MSVRNSICGDMPVTRPRALKLGAEDDPFVDRAGRLLRMAKTLLKRARR